MGIGLFSQTQPIVYTEKVKLLAEEQSLYLIIANGDYIYGKKKLRQIDSRIKFLLTNIEDSSIVHLDNKIDKNKSRGAPGGARGPARRPGPAPDPLLLFLEAVRGIVRPTQSLCGGVVGVCATQTCSQRCL